MRHVAPVVGLVIKALVQLADRFILSTAEQTHGIQQLLWVEIVTDHFTRCADVDHIKRMDAVKAVDVHAVVAVFQNENHAFGLAVCYRCNCMQAKGLPVQVTMRFDIVKQVKSELI